MAMLERVESVPDVQKAVETDIYGRMIDSKGDIDAEPVAALMSYVYANLTHASGLLGLGKPRQLHLAGNDLNAILLVSEETLLAGFLGPNQSAQQIRDKMVAALK